MSKGIRSIIGGLLMMVLSGVTLQAADLVDNGNGTVTDRVTQLVWQQGEGGSKTWTAALAYCESLSLAGQTDWRLPNRKELLSLVDYSRYNPSIDSSFFPNVVASYYWTSTSYANNSYDAWDVYFSNGYVGNSDKSNSDYVRCVRQ
jgi:hypothetical protein